MGDTITLGGQGFALRPLKLGQLRHLLDALEEMSGRSGGALIGAAAKVVAVGIGAAQPELTAERVLEFEATLEELNTAVATVLRVAGLQPAGEARPAASPENDPVTGSAASTAPSPPAAAIPTP